MMNETKELYFAKNIEFDLTHMIVKKELVNYLLKGDKRVSDAENTSLFSIVQQFIASGKHF